MDQNFSSKRYLLLRRKLSGISKGMVGIYRAGEGRGGFRSIK